jgi:hypothetical protein
MEMLAGKEVLLKLLKSFNIHGFGERPECLNISVP